MLEATAAAPLRRREIGSWDNGRPGPTLLVVGGMHGNEPAGVAAAERVLAELRQRELVLDGRLIALAGNLQALQQDRRFVARDLNRGWSQHAIAALTQRERGLLRAEDQEQHELLQRFAEIDRTAAGPLVFLDLHTSSAEGSPFLCLADTIDNRRLGLATGVPIILGIEETLAGASLEWFADRGIAGMAVEGGQHQNPDTVRNLTAVLWLLLDRLRMLPPGQVDLTPHREHLHRAVGATPPIVEIVDRHAIVPADDFRMAPGFVNFARVHKGQRLATDRRGPIDAPQACHVLLPLYQAQGDDGYFLARRVRPFWLWLARWLRTARLGALLPLLPGIRRDPRDRDTLLANKRVARWFVVEIFHLLGFRKEQERDGQRAFSRRRSRPENRRL